ncbi:MAG: hypothetical protein GTO45_21945 [Candidatus Aminicenantes bacterium]|nr:hypothetical protein [Candidatus Aminicenantes bacterium]NIM81426.1 hypothetical protein [Candidatus Aminicenantes bacterium]NIN20826.1 hypothetical protein [Candidatus Aminicenantes bacterium]NIN44612.1 hypothetical protein [Candidatus Aminicenantes bacterium]NIN87428.1 hypothetical protein [Candidatus Aminicenantes bacterium]
MYRAEKERRQAREDTLSLNDYLSRLELKTGFNTMNPDQVGRVSQLTQRTNQFNLSTIRREEGEIIALSRRPRTRCWVVEVCDRFGDYGLVGVVITIEKDDHLFIDTFLLSCRVLGRGVEQAILVCLKKYCRECGLTQLKADYYPTPKNKPFYEFLQRTWNKEQEEEDHTTYSLKTEQIPETQEFGELYYQAAFPEELNQEPQETIDILADHTAVAVVDIREAVSDYRNLGYTCGDIIIDPLQKVKLVMCHQSGFDSIELVSPLDRQSPTAYVVEQNGDIPYHPCYRVRDIRQILTGLEQEGIAFEIVSETKPAVLFDNKDVIFIQVRHVGLVEFLEHRDGDFNVNVNAGEETRHNALQIVVADAEAALKFYKYLGYSVIKTINDGKQVTVTLTKSGAGYIDLIVPGPTAVEERQFLDQNGPHPFRLVFFGLSPKNMENPAPAHYILFQSREQEYKQPDEKQAISISHHQWDVYGLDQDNLLHKNHLLPLRYFTAAKLLTLPLFKVRQPRLETVEYQEPRSELEVRLVNLWKEILRIEILGINTSFFKAGGNSLKAVMMLSKIEKELDAALSLREVFNHPTVKKLALYIENNSRKSEFSTLKPAEKRDRYPLSAAQKRLYFLQLMNPEDTTYNIPITLQLQGSIDIELMEEAYRKLVQRHESLRTSFRVVDGDPVQLIRDRVEFKIEYFNLATKDTKEHEEHEEAKDIISSFLRPFDLAKAPLMRVGLIKTGWDEHVFIVDMHHIVTDGISILLLVSEFLTLYNGGKEESLPGIAIRYRDYCLWQDNLLQREIMKKQEVYWLEKFKGDIPVLRLPTDYPRPEIKSNKGAYAGFEIEPGTAEKLRALAIKEDATMFMVILTIFDILLFKLSRQEDIIVGTVTAGRRHQDLENIVGMFVNTLVLRNYPKDEKSFSQCLKEVRETTLEAFDNQDYQFEDLVGNVLEKRDPGRNPLFDVMFMFGDLDIISIPQFSTISAIGNKTAVPEESGLNVQPYRSGRAIAKFDMLFTGTDTGEKLVFSIGYCTDLFKKETIERFMTYFKEIVSEVKDNESILLKDISISHNLVMAKSNLYLDQESDFEF